MKSDSVNFSENRMSELIDFCVNVWSDKRKFPFEIMAARATILKSHSVNFMEIYMSDFWGDLEEGFFRKWPRSDLQYRYNICHLEIIFLQFQGKPFFIFIFSMYVGCD